MNRRSFRALTTAVGAVLALGLPGLASATDLTKFNTIFDTNFTSAGIGGMRGHWARAISRSPGSAAP